MSSILTGGLGGDLLITDGYGDDDGIDKPDGAGVLSSYKPSISGVGRMFTMYGHGDLTNYPCAIKGVGYIKLTFEFNGTNIQSVDEQSFYVDSASFRSTKDGARYADAYNKTDDPAAFVEENKIVIKVKNISVGTPVSDRKYTPVYEMYATFDDSSMTILVNKKKSFDNAFFSNMFGKKNYIFTLDSARKSLVANVIDGLDGGLSGKNNVLNQIKF